jgi:hypothetical protein
MFIDRNEAGHINGLFRKRQRPDQEELPDDHPAVLKNRADFAALLSNMGVPKETTARIAGVPLSMVPMLRSASDNG